MAVNLWSTRSGSLCWNRTSAGLNVFPGCPFPRVRPRGQAGFADSRGVRTPSPPKSLGKYSRGQPMPVWVMDVLSFMISEMDSSLICCGVIKSENICSWGFCWPLKLQLKHQPRFNPSPSQHRPRSWARQVHRSLALTPRRPWIQFPSLLSPEQVGVRAERGQREKRNPSDSLSHSVQVFVDKGLSPWQVKEQRTRGWGGAVGSLLGAG